MRDGPTGSGVLARVAQVAREVGADSIADEAEALAFRLGEGRFFVACLGQFKRGKSTLINALLGEELLPTGVVPVTAVVTVVRWGASASARVRLRDGAWHPIALDDVAEYVAEECNPENEKGVTGVEVFAPSTLLRDGMCLVDTPGIGSVFAGNTEATRDFVPHIDAVLVVLGADPPISGAELDLVEDATKLVSRLVVVMTKADRLTEEERSQGRDFAARVLAKRLGRAVGPIFEVSAVEKRRGSATRDWGALEAALVRLASEGVEVVLNAEVRGTHRLRERLAREIDEQTGALVRPREESERRIDGLRRSVADAERALDEMGYLFTAVQDRLTRSFQATRDAFLARARKEATGGLVRAVDSRPEGSAREAMELALSIARTRVESWRAEVAPEAERTYREAVARFVDLANEFLQRVASAGDPALAALPVAFEPDMGFRTKPEFYFNELLTLADPRVSTRLAALLGSRERIASDAVEYLERLFETNSSRVANDLIAQVLESRRRLQQDVRETLRSVVARAERALERAEGEQARGTTSVEAAMARLRRARSELDEAL
jgi:predicted GTPase